MVILWFLKTLRGFVIVELAAKTAAASAIKDRIATLQVSCL